MNSHEKGLWWLQKERLYHDVKRGTTCWVTLFTFSPSESEVKFGSLDPKKHSTEKISLIVLQDWKKRRSNPYTWRLEKSTSSDFIPTCDHRFCGDFISSANKIAPHLISASRSGDPLWTKSCVISFFNSGLKDAVNWLSMDSESLIQEATIQRLFAKNQRLSEGDFF